MSESKQSLPQWFRDNLSSILISFLLALTVWLVANQEQNPIVEQPLVSPIDITVRGIGDGLVITNDYPEVVQVRLRAQQETWSSISSEDIRVILDLTGLEAGEHTVPLVFDISTQASLVSSNPDKVQIDLEELVSVEYPVILDVTGSPAIGYGVGDIVVDPLTVMLEGPASQIESVERILAEIDITNTRDTIETSVVVIPQSDTGDSVQDIRIIPSTINLVVPVAQEAGFREVSIQPSTTGLPAEGYYLAGITPDPNRVTIQGAPSIIRSMPSTVNTEVVDLTGLTETRTIEVALVLPAGVTAVDNQTVAVTISIEAQPGSRTLTLPLRFTGLTEGLEASVSPESIEVIFFGPLPMLSQLDPETNVIVTLDLLELEVGTYQLEPNVEIIGNDAILVASVLPNIVEVEITEIVSE